MKASQIKAYYFLCPCALGKFYYLICLCVFVIFIVIQSLVPLDEGEVPVVLPGPGDHLLQLLPRHAPVRQPQLPDTAAAGHQRPHRAQAQRDPGAGGALVRHGDAQRVEAVQGVGPQHAGHVGVSEEGGEVSLQVEPLQLPG